MKNCIIITGAAGGLGSAIVNAALTEFPNHLIIATDIDQKILTLFSSERVLQYQMDVTDEGSIHTVREELEQKGIRLWGLVNNAGISDFFPVSERPKEELERIFAINTFGPVNMVRAYFPHLIETNGRVVQISSESIRLPAAFHPYAASKISLEALSVSLRNELALKDVHLSIIRPGAIDTPFLNDLTRLKERSSSPMASVNDQGSIFNEYMLNFAEKAPEQIHNITSPDKVAAVVVKALSSKKPKRYYHVNNNPKLRIAQRLPHWIKDYFMRKMLKSS